MKINRILLPFLALTSLVIALGTITKFYSSPIIWFPDQTSSYSLGYSIGQMIGMPLKIVVFTVLAIKFIRKFYSNAINHL